MNARRDILIDLVKESKQRERISAQIDALILRLEASQEGGATEVLAMLLMQVIETRKAAETQEKALKKHLREQFQGGDTLDYPDVFIWIEKRARANLDKEALMARVGSLVIEECTTMAEYEVMQVRRKVSGGGSV